MDQHSPILKERDMSKIYYNISSFSPQKDNCEQQQQKQWKYTVSAQLMFTNQHYVIEVTGILMTINYFWYPLIESVPICCRHACGWRNTSKQLFAGHTGHGISWRPCATHQVSSIDQQSFLAPAYDIQHGTLPFSSYKSGVNWPQSEFEFKIHRVMNRLKLRGQIHLYTNTSVLYMLHKHCELCAIRIKLYNHGDLTPGLHRLYVSMMAENNLTIHPAPFYILPHTYLTADCLVTPYSITNVIT